MLPNAPVATESLPPVKDAKENIQPAALVAPSKSAKNPILPQLANKIGRDEKFEWVTGQFETESGNLVLYYATPDTVDKYHGRIVLMPDKIELKQYRSGDLVSVRGQLTQRQTMQGIVPIYHVSMATLIERQKQ
jgi:hypothetical protein